MNKIIDIAIEKASHKKALLFSALFCALLVTINYSPIGVAGLLKITGGANILDFEFGYTCEEARGMLAALGPEGRAFYLAKILPADFLFPLSYMLFYTGFIALLLKNLNPARYAKYTVIIPAGAMLFDWLENAGVIAMLADYPDIPAWAASLASVSGMLKMIFTVGSITAIGVLLAMYVFKIIRPK